jgi:hypothetical protein
MRRQHLIYRAKDILEDKKMEEYRLSQMGFIEKHLPKAKAIIMPGATK